MNCFIELTKQSLFAVAVLFLGACASTTVLDSPRTTAVREGAPDKDPAVIWTSRSLNQPYDYVGRIKSRSISYNGALERLVEGGRQLKADAIVDIHKEDIGFLTQMEAFAIKFK